jgi:hypothetical protein
VTVDIVKDPGGEAARLRAELDAAKTRYEQSRKQFQNLVEASIVQADHGGLIAQAEVQQRQAFRKYALALFAFNRFVLKSSGELTVDTHG